MIGLKKKTTLLKMDLKETISPADNIIKGLSLFETDNNSLRDEAKTKLTTLSFPTSKTEYWKYTRVGKIIRSAFGIQKSQKIKDIEPFIPDGLDTDYLLIENGFLNANLSRLTDWDNAVHSIESFNDASINYKNDFLKSSNEIFNCINDAYFTGGILINIPENKAIQKPLLLINAVTQSQLIALPKIIVNAQASSTATIIEKQTFDAVKDSFLNTSFQAVIEPDARLNYFVKQNVKTGNFLIGSQNIHQYKNSCLNINTATLRGTIVRNNLNIFLKESGTETHLNGVFFAGKNDHIDNHTFVDHIASGCQSNELYKGIIAENGTGVFNGKVLVNRNAQKTNAFQQNNNIVLSDNGVVYSKPELEIYADDVKCSHGSTTGQFDKDALFYMRTRGIGIKKAKALLLHAFVYESIENIAIEEYKNELLDELTRIIDNA